jgi:1,4-alpha-glucan branching enzyme
VWDIDFDWKSTKWLNKSGRGALNKPWSVYEVHLGSWRKPVEAEDSYYNCRDIGSRLIEYVLEMGFTHVQFLPLTEHPFSGSWGYQSTGFFAPTSRYGTPQDFMAMVDDFHAAGIGIILDWVPSHFPEDSFALANFDGSQLFEHHDPRKGFHPDWKSLIFNYGRYEVRSFLISSAMFWADVYKVDALRVDAVASMLYLDYSRKDGEWESNIHGGNENLDAVSFLKELNQAMYSNFPEIQMIAEESTSWPRVSSPVHEGGLGFGMKWMMGWMNDTLNYFKIDPLFRSHHQNDITFSIYYAFSENFMLPLSHDEVVHGKGALIDKMPGDEWQKFANLRTLFAYMFMHPGAKLLFMGNEFAQNSEWNYRTSLDWNLTAFAPHHGMQQLIKDLNRLYRNELALSNLQFDVHGFEWIDFHDTQNCTLSFIRRAENPKDFLIIICNLTPIPHNHYCIGVPQQGKYTLIFNSDSAVYWGSGFETSQVYEASHSAMHGRIHSIQLKLPPLSVLVIKPA